MTLVPCSHRYEGLRGGLITLLVCGNKDHEKHKQMVTPEDCSQCPVRKGGGRREVKRMALQRQKTHGRPRILADGTMVYPSRGWQLPPVPSGDRRKSEDLRSADTWIFIPTIPRCGYREHQVESSPCGACKITYFCSLEGRRTRVVTACITCGKRSDGLQTLSR